MDFSNPVMVWVVLGGVLVLLELVIPGAILSFLGLAALVVAGLLHFKVITSVLVSITLWFIISIIFIFVLRTFVLRFMPGDIEMHSVDEDQDALGSVVEIIEDVLPEKNGRIRFRDTTWKAQAEVKIMIDEKAVIAGRDGNIWIIKKI
jgi:membrane protein implicated in regulation of membrane protease activity